MRPAVVAEFGAALPCDVEAHGVPVEEVEDPLHAGLGQVALEDGRVLFLRGQNVGQSQWLRLWRYMLTLLLHAVRARHASRRRAIRRVVRRRFMACGVLIVWG